MWICIPLPPPPPGFEEITLKPLSCVLAWAGSLEGVFRLPPFQHTLPSASADRPSASHLGVLSSYPGIHGCDHNPPPSLLAQKVPQAQCSWKGSWTPTSKLIQTQTWNSLPPLPANCLLLGWPKSSFGFKVWIKDTFFIFTKNFIEQCIHHFFPLLRSAIFQATS